MSQRRRSVARTRALLPFLYVFGGVGAGCGEYGSVALMGRDAMSVDGAGMDSSVEIQGDACPESSVVFEPPNYVCLGQDTETFIDPNTFGNSRVGADRIQGGVGYRVSIVGLGPGVGVGVSVLNCTDRVVSSNFVGCSERFFRFPQGHSFGVRMLDGIYWVPPVHESSAGSGPAGFVELDPGENVRWRGDYDVRELADQCDRIDALVLEIARFEHGVRGSQPVYASLNSGELRKLRRFGGDGVLFEIPRSALGDVEEKVESFCRKMFQED